MRFTEDSNNKTNENRFKFTVTKDIGDIPETDLSIKYGHYGDYTDKYYLIRTTNAKNGKKYTKSFALSATELNALADFLNQ